jgi:hypothetical protein
MICSGINTNFRELYNKSEVKIYSYFVGLELKNINDKIIFPNCGNVIINNSDNVVLMYPVIFIIKKDIIKRSQNID